MTTPSQEIESSLIDEVPRRHLTMTGDTSLPENYHLEGGANYGVWAYRIKNLLLKYGRFHYCITAPSKTMSEEEKTARQQVLSIINSNAKNNALNILRRYDDPYECWTGLKKRYESDSGPRRVMLIDRFFALRKTESVSMDVHLTEIKEVANLLEEVEVVIPEDIIVYYTLKNLPKEYEIFKRMQIAGQTLPTYEQLEAKLISEETFIKWRNSNKKKERPCLCTATIREDPNRITGSANRHQTTDTSLEDSSTQEAHRIPDFRTQQPREDPRHREPRDQQRVSTTPQETQTTQAPTNQDTNPGDLRNLGVFSATFAEQKGILRENAISKES